MVFFTAGIWLDPDSLWLPFGVMSLGVESETLVQSSLLPAANGSACSLASLSVPIEATNRG